LARKTSIEFYKESLKIIRDPGSRQPVCFLYGEETFFLDLLQDEIIKLIPVEQRDFNLDLLYGRECSPQQITGIARSFPMMSELRIVIVRDFRKLGDNLSETGEKLADLIPYLEQPNPSTLLVLIDDKGPDKRTTLGQILSGKGKGNKVYTQKFDKLPDYKLPDWVKDWAEHRYQKSIDPAAAQILTQLVGNNLQLLSTEIDKVCTFVDTEKRVTVGHVKKIIGSYREYSVIELKEAVIDRDLDKSLSIVEQMLLKSNADTGEVIRTVGFFYSVFSNIWQIRRLLEKGMDKSRVQQEMGVTSNWYFNQLWKDASNFRLSEMPQIFEALLDADQAAKGFSTLDTSAILLLLIKRIVG
jgi:DNA polymerase III subunit delta